MSIFFTVKIYDNQLVKEVNNYLEKNNYHEEEKKNSQRFHK